MFEALGVRLVGVTAALDNVRSAKVIEAAGFVRMGERDSVRPDGTVRQVALLGADARPVAGLADRPIEKDPGLSTGVLIVVVRNVRSYEAGAAAGAAPWPASGGRWTGKNFGAIAGMASLMMLSTVQPSSLVTVSMGRGCE
jgi:hypothetical protein